MEAWTSQWKIPTDLKNYANVFHHLYRAHQKLPLNTEDVYQFFNLADAWRKSERLHKAIDALGTLGFEVERWHELLQTAISVDAGLIAKNLQTNDGVMIQNAVAASRRQAIAACL